MRRVGAGRSDEDCAIAAAMLPFGNKDSRVVGILGFRERERVVDDDDGSVLASFQSVTNLRTISRSCRTSDPFQTTVLQVSQIMSPSSV